MSYTVGRLLVHDDSVPAAARDALRAAYSASPERQDEMLESAARILSEETDLECQEVRELVGLSIDGCA